MTGAAPTNRILFIGPAPIGDTILTTGVLEQLRAENPEAQFTLALSPATTGLFRGFPNLERLLPLAKQRNGLHWWHLWRATVATRWAISVDMRGSAMTRFLRSSRRYIRQGGVVSGVRAADDAAKVIGLNQSPPLAIHTDSAAKAAIAALVPNDRRALLVLAPGSNWGPKRWPADRFAALARRLASAGAVLSGARIVVLGGPGEEPMTGSVAAGLSGHDVIDLGGSLPLLEAAALFERSQLFVGNDSGLMHLAAAVGAPTLGLFGPTDDQRYAPFGRRAACVRGERTFAESLALYRANPIDDSLLDDLSVERAEKAALDLLAASRVAG
jgi:heptosyltransferase-3